MDIPNQNNGSSPAHDATAKDTPHSVGQTIPENLALKHEKPVPMESSTTNPVLPPNFPVIFCFDGELPHGMICTDRLISFQCAYKLRVAEEDHRVALEALIAGLS
ncbi:uncharacterized protein N7473_008259 [Penicillium subrubescens]|uniref:Uncharacterized protein n=1 Tax=Penicillium subrubescens TaxID=1316194 RepID=A0A1Q5TKH4_9EURO|nr:uncharacterized protein N7473_008259 [Penicillium subrubescens]KAJ5892031.1 hypothetical protein N7473_008259 [Penicillium subrubescens]OKP00727.1 hypothetical protein PENSUB_7658 [Penicillium subrubescens]